MSNALATCPHCGAASVRAWLRAGDRAAYRCGACGGRFNNPAVDTDVLYDRDYYLRNYAPRRAEQLALARGYVARLTEHAPRSGPILDYGCGAGSFLEALIESGFQGCVGADVSPDALALVQEQAGDRVRVHRIGHDALPSERFAAICLMDTISHIPDLRETLMRLIDCHLERSGVLVIRTPDIRPLYYRAVRLLTPLVGQRRATKLAFANSRHVLFSRESLRRYLGSLGMTVVCEERCADDHLYAPGGEIRGWIRCAFLRVMNSQSRPVFVIARRAESGQVRA